MLEELLVSIDTQVTQMIRNFFRSNEKAELKRQLDT